jgi:hypothetical protein
MINQHLNQEMTNPHPMFTANTQPMPTTIPETNALTCPIEKTLTNSQVQAQRNWNSYDVQKFQEFMALQSAQLSSQSSGGFDLSTVGHNRSITAMIQPPSELPHAVDLLQHNIQQTPASLVGTRADQRANNQKKEARKQLSMAINAVQPKNHTPVPNVLEGQSLNLTDEQ